MTAPRTVRVVLLTSFVFPSFLMFLYVSRVQYGLPQGGLFSFDEPNGPNADKNLALTSPWLSHRLSSIHWSILFDHRMRAPPHIQDNTSIRL